MKEEKIIKSLKLHNTASEKMEDEGKEKRDML